MADSIFDPLSGTNRTSSPMVTFGEPAVAARTGYPYMSAQVPQPGPFDLSGRTKVRFVEPEDATAVRFGSTADPMQLDMDPFGRNTVEWGKVHGTEKPADYVLSANVFGHVMSRERLEQSEKGRRLMALMEDVRNGRRRDFWDAITDWSVTDLPFFGMFAAVGRSINDAMTVHRALDKMQKGEPVTEDEALTTRLYMAEQEKQGQGTWGATVGDIVRAAPGFMVEISLSGWALGGIRAALGKFVSKSAETAARFSLDRFTKYTARGLVEEGFAKAIAGSSGSATKAALRTGWQSVDSAMRKTVRDDAVRALAPMVKEQLGSTAEMAEKIAGARADIEIARALARNSPKSGVVRWLNGTAQAALDHVSRGLLDFGHYGTDVYSATGKELGSAMKTLGHAIGALGPEALIRGSLVGLPQAAVVKPLVGLAFGGKVVSPQQLSLEAQAVRTGNRDLFNSAESYAAGLNLAEYVSESAGRGFGLAFRSAGLGLFGAKAMGVATGSMGLLPKGAAEEAGSAIRRWIAKAVGSTDDMVRGHLAAEVKAVSRKLHGRVPDDVVETFVRTGNASVLGEAAAEVGAKPREFIAKAVKETIASDRLALSYRTFWRYALADKMLRMGWGPDQMTRWLRHAGYDGIVEEMMEERYNDFAKGLFGLDDRAAKDKGFFKNIRQAFDNLNPGWEQLTAEAVGFAVPLGARVAVNSIHRAAGGSDLSYIQRYASTVREFRGANNIVEMRQEDYFRVAEEEIGRLRSRLTGKDADGNQLLDSEGKPIEGLEKQITARETELKAEGATPETIERETAELREEMKDLQNRISVAEDQVRKQRTVDGAGQRNAESILAFEATNTTGARTGGDVPTSQQAKRGVTAKDAIVEGAARAGEILARAKADAVDPKTMPLGSRIVHRITNVLGAIVTGDLAMAMEDPMAWSMVDRGMDRTIVGRLAEAYNSHFDAAKARLMRDGKASPSSDEVREAMREGYEAEARSIAQSWLAAQGIRIFSAREMLEQARGVVMDRHGTLDGHEDEVDQVRDQIAERTLRILSGGALQSADVGRIARGIISISDDSPFLNDKITDAALRLSGFRGLEQVAELRPETDLRSAIGARSVDGKLVSDIAKMDLSALKDGEQEILQRVAAQLGYTPNHDAAGKNTMAFTEEAITRMNQRVHRLCRLAMVSASPYIRTYRKAADEAEFSAPGRAGSGDFIRVVQDGRGFHWTETVAETGAKVSRTAVTETDLEASMERMGFERTSAPVTFVLAREIRAKDPAVMLTQLGMDREYIAKMTAGKERDALAVDNHLVHPALRERVNSEGTTERIPYEEAQRIFRDELSKALRFREVMSLSEGERLAAFRESADETDAQVLSRLNEAEYYYKSVFGSEQGQEGYLPVLEKTLRAAGVEMPGAGNRSYSRYLAGQDGYYTLNTRLLNFHEGQAFVLVDLDRDVDYDGAILSRAISNGLVAFRDLWAYDERTKTYSAFSTVVRDMARRLDRVAVDLARESIAAGQPGEARAMMALLDRIMGGSNVDRPKVEAIVWLVRNAVFGQAMREAKTSRSTTADVAAEARLAQALRQTQEFWPFLGFSDLILGGNGFAGAARQKGADTFGVARLAAAFSGNPNYMVEDLLKGGLLPVDRDGRRMPVQDFMDLVNRTLAARSKSVDQTVRDRVAQAADRDVMEFIGELRKVAGLNTYEDLRNFMEEVLRQSGIRAGNTEDLRKWRSAVEHSRVYREALEAEVAELQRQIDGLEAEVGRLRNEGAESKDRIEDLLAQIDVLKARRNAQEGTREPAVPGSDEASDEAAETGTPAAEDVPANDEDERPSPSLDETPDTWDPDSGLGADEYDISGSYEVPPSAGDTVRTDSKDADGNTATGGVELPDPVSMTPEARRHAMWTAVAAMRAKGPEATVDSFMATLRDLFPGMSDADAAETMAEFSARADEASRRARAEDETVLDLVAQELDDNGSDIKDYDGWNDKAVQAYNSLAPMLEMMETALPLAKRNFQGLMGYLRADVERRLRDFQETDRSDIAEAYRLVDEMLSPRRSNRGKTYAERLAYHRAVLSRVFDAKGFDSDRTLKALIRVFTQRTTAESGVRQMENAPLAAFISFLASLHTAGTRQSIALLFSSSTACSAVSVGNVVRMYSQETAGDSYDPTKEGTTFRSSDLQINTSVTTRGSISVGMATAAFRPLIGMTRGHVERVGTKLERLAAEAVGTMAPMAFSGESAGADFGFTFENVGGDSITGDVSTRIYTAAPRGMLLQDIETFRHDAEIVAGILDKVLGRANALSRVLTSPMLFDRMKAKALRSDDFRGLVQMRTAMMQFAPDSKGHIRALDVVRSILLRLYNESSTKTGVGRARLADIVQAAFATGDLEQASLAFPGANADTRDQWAYFLDEAVQAMPDTVVPAKKVQYRSTKDSSVAVAAPGMIPIVVRYVTAQDDQAASAFRTLCEGIVREDALRIYWRQKAMELGGYINPINPGADLDRLVKSGSALSAGEDEITRAERVMDEYIASQGGDKAAQEARAKSAAEVKQRLLDGAKHAVADRIAELGGIDAIVDSCLDTMTWPDEAHTPIVARNLSVDYSPAELGRACSYTYMKGTGLWYIPLFGGDHSCNNLLQVPAARLSEKDRAKAYLDAARALNDALGVSMMMADTKRSAITSADAAAVPMVGCEVEWTDGDIPVAKSVKFGEARHHLIVNFATTGGEEYSQEAAHGETLYSGFGAEALRDSAKDPTLRISKFHALGTGFWLDFRKSAVTLVSDSWLTDGGADAPGTMTRAMADHILKYRTPESRRSSSDQATDEDSYKVGPLTSVVYQVATGEADSNGVIPGTKILAYVKDLLKSGMKPEKILEQEVRMVNRSKTPKGELSEPMKLAEVLEGLDIREVQGLHAGDSGTPAAFDISYRDNSMLALKVANIAHRAKPHLGSNGKNYTVDALAKGVEQTIRKGVKLSSPGAVTQNQVITTLNAWAILGSAVATDPVSVERELEDDPRLQTLKANGADPRGLEYRKLRAETVAKRIRKSMLSPLNKVEATLTACGATLSKTGKLLDHTVCPMRRDVHGGSVVFGAEETADGGLYAGFRRRFADAEVNVQAAWFRYGMFLDPSLEGYRRLFGNLEGAALMQEVENTVRNIYVADTRYDQEVRKYRDALAADRRSGVKEFRPEPKTLEDSRNERNTMRKAFLSCFTDHHGIRMDEKKLKAKMKDRTVLIDAWRLVSFADLMVSDGKGGTRFDRTAFRMGDDGVHRAVYNDKGELDEAKSSKGRMMYLAGTAFGVPRTPSYNGGAWLQVVRASFPVRETFDGETWSVGADAVVALDPYTRDEILGCDNDGDESALFMFSPNESGYVPVGDVEQCLPGMDLSTWDHSFASGSALESKKNRSDMLAKASAMNVDGVRYVKRTGDAFEITPAGQRAVSNQLVQGLIAMAHDLDVPPGTGRRPFASEISGRTKAQPFDDARWWKRTKDEAPGFEGVTRLTDIMPPDIIEDGQTIGDPELQEKVSLSAKKSAKARAMIVSAAAALHAAYISGCFEGTAENNPFTLFGPGFTPDGWQAFMRHFDGLSNATFDDVKERICARLGLTPEMIDTLVVDLLNMPRPPQTDREWFDALERYVLSVRDRLPDGTSVWKPNLDSSISGEDDKSRMFMAGVSDEYADTWDFLAKNALFGGGGAKGARRDGLLKAFGLMRVTRPDGSIAYTIDLRNAPENSARRELGRFLLSDARLTAGVIEAALERGGRNPVAGYLLWLGGAGCGTLRKFMDGEAEDLGALRTTLQVRGAEFRKFFRRRRAWMKAKDFAHAINYTQVDPGSPTSYRTVERADKAYADVMAVMYQRLSPDRQKLVLHMRQATRMGYSCGMVNAGTPGARAHEAVTAVQANPRMNSDIVDEFQRMGDIASRDDALAVQETVVHAAETDGLVDDRDRDMLQDNMTSIPYVVAALQSLPRTGFTKDIETTRRFLEALAGKEETPGLRIFGLRNTIESMFRVMYALSVTSDAGIDHPGLSFFGMLRDAAYRKSDELKYREGRTVRNSYGLEKPSLPLSTIFPLFAARDLASMARMRRAIAELGHRGSRPGALDTAERKFRNDDEKLARYLQAKSFNITFQNLLDAESEAVNAKRAGSRKAAKAVIDAIKTSREALERVTKAMGMESTPDKVVITVSDMIEKLLPVYSAVTTPVQGAPSYEQFSGSLLAMLPGVYPTWSRRQADNDAAYAAVRSKMRSQDTKPVGFIDCLAALRFAPVDHDATADRLKTMGVDSDRMSEALEATVNSRPGRVAEPVRQNPENRTLVDLFAYDGVLFKAARLHDAMAASRRGLVAERPAETEPVTAAEDALPAEERATDQTFARLSESLRTMLSAIPGLNVEVDGNTMVVTGTLSGEQALKRRGIEKPVRTVIRIDLCPAGYGTTAADLNSPANAASITNALREAGIVDISPENFLTKLSLKEREALVRRVMPEALAKAGTGYALRTPSWQMDSEGILTLAGAIKLRKADGRTAFHEYFHSVVGMMRSLGMFTGGERAALEKAFGKARHEAELFDEEKAADMFADYVMKRRAKAAKGPVASFLDRILDFVKRLLAVMQGKGFHYNESLKVGDVQVTGREMLFNMVLSGQVMDSLDSAKIVKTRLDAAHRVQEGLAQDAAMARMDAAMSKTHVDRFEETMKSKAPMDAAKDRLLETRTVQALEMNPVASFQDLLDETVKRRGGTVASERGGETAQPQLSSLGEASAEVAAQFDAVPPGNGITGESTSGAERLSQLGHALAQAIADGMDAVDPAVRGLLESHSDLSQLHYSSKLADVTTEAVYSVVNHGLFSAAETLGVDLKAKDQLVKNIVYANMILLYDDLAVRLGYGGRKNAIRMAREHKGEAVRRKEFITRHDVAALLLTAGGLSYDDIAKDAYATFAELRAEANGHPDLLRNLAHLERNLRRIVAKTAYKGDPIHEIMAGVKMGERDLETGVEADATEDTGATSRTALRNRQMYMFGDRRFQRAIKAAMRTAYTLSAAKKLYQILGIEESQLKGNVRIPGGFGDRVKVRDRRTARTVADSGATRTTTLPDGTQINFAESGHEYYSIAEDGSRIDYVPVTSLVHVFTNQFDAMDQSRRMRRTEEEAAALREEWDEEREESSRRGTLIHSVYEDVLMGRPVRAQATDEREREMFQRAAEIAQRILRDYEVLGTELIVADPHGSGAAGTIDCLARNRHTGRLTIIDHKTVKRIFDMAYGDKMMLGELDKLPDSTFNQYSLQLNLYRELLRRGGVQGVTVADGEPIDLVINLYNGYSDEELGKIAEHDAHVYRHTASPEVRARNLANIKRERWITDVPDLDDAVSAMLDHAKANKDRIVRDAVPEAQIPEPVTNAEVADALGMSMNDLLDDRTVFDPFSEVGLYVNNPGEWLASTVRAKFGGKPLRELFTEHGELEAAVKRFHHVQNWWAMYLGENFTEGHKLLRVKKDKGHFIMEDGHVSYDEEGHERTGFDNYHYRALGMDHVHGSTVDVTLDRTDKETIDFWLKAAYFHAMHDRYMLTGIDGVYITFGDIQKSDGSRWTESDFSADKVLARYNGSHVGRQISKVDMMLAEVLSGNQLPDFVTGDDTVEERKLGLYNRLVEGVVETFNEMQRAYSARGSNLSPALANRMFLEGMAKRGLMKYTVDPKGVPAHGTVTVSVAEIEEHWKKSGAYRKLVKAGRDEKMLTMDAVTASARSAYEECQRIARKNPWMMEGDGRHFNAMGSMMPFFAGGGVFMYYANRIGTDAKKDVSQRLNEYEESFLRTLQSPDGDVTDGQLMMLHDYFRTGTDAGQALRTAIANGEYVEGSAKALKTGLVVAPEDLAHSHRVAETIYRRLCEISWAQERHADLVELSGGRGSVARMLDFYAQTAGEYTGWAAAGMNATQMYELNGVLPANFQIFHAVNVKLQDAARTAQFRNTFVGFLFSSDENGMPIAYAKPSLVSRGYADDGIPEEIWEYAARWWAEANGRQYDEAMSGRANAARLYDEIITANESKTVKGRHFRQLDGNDRAGLTSVSDFAAVDDDASSDDVNSRNALNGGEAYGYAKMLFNVKRVVGGKAQSLLLDRIASFSKTLSVQHSAFFPIATKMESPAAAVGFWTMLASNFAPGTARRLDKAAQNFDRLFHTHFSDTINRDFVGFRDILEMMDTNDPFLAEAVNICSALGISLSTRLVNPAEENKTQVEADMARLTDAARGFLGDKGAQFVKGAMEGFLFRGSERAFTYALNATKIATALQIAQVCRRKCREEGRAFNLVREVKPYAAYINAEVGGIDPMRYAWANPRFRKMMSWSMFSWEWTKGAWSAGGGEIIETALGGGHFTTPETRALMWGRWLSMYGSIMIGVPMAFQAAIKLLSWCMGGYGGDDDDPWWTWENERKVGMSAFNLTPLLKTISKSETALWLKDKPVVGSLIPAYTGKDHYNTSGSRKYYMHFGKQGWEFFRWFRHPVEQFLNKLSMPTQRIMEGILGYNMASREYDLPMSKHSFAARWLNPFLQTSKEGAWFNLLTAFVPFSWNAMGTYGDAGALPVLGPVSMGSSYQANIKDAQAALTAWALNEREGYSYGFAKAGKNRKLLASRITYILKDAQKNGMDPKTILTEASGLAAKELYRRLFDLLPNEPGADIDVRAVTKVARGLNRLGVTQSQAMESLRDKFGRRGLDWDLMPAAQRIRVRSIIGETMRNPYTADEESVDANTQRNLMRLGVQGEKGKDY